MTIGAGVSFGPYEIVEAIGAGGMGEVWKARDTRLGRDVALKFLPEDFARNEKLLARFEREAQVISSLNHPNICTLYDVGEESGKRYLVMELIEGESLADRLTKGPLTLPQVLKYGAQIAGALEKAHKQGIIHRDLKPGNVMLTKSDAKLLDFGLARATEDQAPVQGLTDLPTAARPLTEEGTILGTFQYMAPEQLEGQEAGPRTDIFALGALLYEMATGKRAFEGKTRTSLIAAIVSSQPAPVSSVVDVAPPALDHVIRQCLEKDPEDRWQSAIDVARELEWISEGGSQVGVPALVSSSRRRREGWKTAAIVLFALLATVLGWLLLRGPAETPDRKVFLRIGPPDGWDEAGLPTVSPDGSKIAFIASDGPVRAIFVRSLDGFETEKVPGTESAGGKLFWSPSGEELAFSADRKLKRVSLDGREPVTICSSPAMGGAWNEDDVIVFTPNWGEGLYRVDANGGDPVPLTQLDKSKRESVHKPPHFFPDGNHFAFFARTAHGVNSEIYLASLDDPTPRRILSADSLQGILPGNVLLFIRDGRVLAQKVDLASASPVGEHVTIIDRVRFLSGFAEGAVSAGGGVIAYRLPKLEMSTLRWRGRDGSIIEETGITGPYEDVKLSSDSARALVTKTSDKGIGTDLWVLEFERELETRLTNQPGDDFFAHWSPDGRTVVFVSDRAGLYDLYSTTADGAKTPEILLGDELPFDKGIGSFTPDGEALVIGSFGPDTNGDVHLLELETKTLSTLVQTEFNERPRAVSPDGSWFAYVSNQSGRDELYIQRFDGGGERVQVSTGGAGAADWVGDEIIFFGAEALWSAKVRLTSETVKVSAPVKLRDSIEGIESYDTIDGQRFLTRDRIEEHPDPTPIHVIVNWELEGLE